MGDDFFVDKNFISRAISRILDYSSSNEIVAYFSNSYLYKENKLIETNPLNFDGTSPAIINGTDVFLNKFKYGRLRHASTIYRRSTAISIGFYRHKALNSDLESILRLTLHGDVIMDENFVSAWFVHPDNASSKTKFEFSLNSAEFETYRSILSYAKEILPENLLNNWLQPYKEHAIRNAIDIYLSRRELSKALELIKNNGKVNLYYLKKSVQIMKILITN